MDIKDIKDLILTIDNTDIEEVKIEKSDIKIMISKASSNKGINSVKGNIADLQSKHTSVDEISNITEAFGSKDNGIEGNRSAAEDENTYIVKSPIVGTFYKAPSPDSSPFVKEGDMVQKGQALCIIEAMKIMNEIECEVEGKVVEIFVEDEDIVEYGQPLMKIRR